MKSHLLILLLVIIAGRLGAQKNIVDSTKSLIKKSQPDTVRVRLLQELAEIYRVSSDIKNLDSAVYYGNKSLTLAQNLHDRSGEARSLIVLGKSSRYEINPVKAVEYFQKALALSEEIKDTLLIIYSLKGWALLYYYKSDFRQELSYYIRVKDLSNKINNLYELRAALGLIGKTYFLLDKTDSAEYFLQKAIAVKLNQEDPFSIAHMGRLRLYQQNYNEALQYFKKALAIYKNKNDKFRIAMGYYDIGRLFEEEEKLDSAVYNYKISYEQADGMSDSLYIIESVGAALAAVYEKMNNLSEALRYYKLSGSAKDGLKNEENLQKLLNLEFRGKEQKREIEIAKTAYLNKVKLFLSLGVIAIVSIISLLLYRNNLNKRKTNLLLKQQKEKVENTLTELKSTQAQLIQSEKMASLGELTAGIAHEIQNPLNFVNNFSEVNKELIEELKIKNEKLKIEDDEVKDLLNDLADNEEKINHHGKRADAIVKGMLQHSRQTKGVKEPTDINALCDEYLRLSYHGMRAKEKEFNAELKTDFDGSIGKINIVPQDIGRVLLNLFNNAFYAVNERQKVEGARFKALVSIQTKKVNDKIEIRVSDNGNGIPQNIIDKIFQPFFTTKPTGQGTGLGLSLAYDIITKEHNGKIKVESKEGEGSEFTIQLPIA